MKNLLLLILSVLIVNQPATAATVSITSQYPSPAGIYDWLQIVPTNSPPACSAPAHTGRFYFDILTLSVKACNGHLGTPAWIPLSGPWTEDGSNNIFLSGATTHTKKIGIGTNTPRFRLTLDNNTGVANPDGGIFARGTLTQGSDLGLLPAVSRPLSGPESYFIWHPKKGIIRAGSLTGAGHVATTAPVIGQNLEWDDGWMGQNSVAFGQDTTALDTGTVVAGGARNLAYSPFSSVGGGSDNSSGYYSNAPQYTTVSGGQGNHVRSAFGFVGGGSGNIAGDDDPLGSIPTQYTTVTGGRNNNARFNFSSIGGGDTNIIYALNSTISGGANNLIDSLNFGAVLTDTSNSIGGGLSNNILGSGAATISGGNNNVVSADHGTIGGGEGNRIETTDPSLMFDTISGGSNNVISNGHGSFIGGGVDNAVIGGAKGSILGGRDNRAQAHYATVLGGRSNQANGENSLVGGSYITVSNLAPRTIALGSPAAPTTINQPDAVILLPQGNVGIGTVSPAEKLDVAGNGIFSGNVGIGITPAQRLHINGAVKLEQIAPIACNVANAGILYRSTSKGLCYCPDGGGPMVALYGICP